MHVFIFIYKGPWQVYNALLYHFFVCIKIKEQHVGEKIKKH